MDDPMRTLERLVRSISNPIRARIYLELLDAGPLSATQIARRLDLPVPNVYYHLKSLLKAGVVTAPEVPAETYFTERLYDLGPAVGAGLDLLHLNETLMDAMPNARRSLVSAICAAGAARLISLAERYLSIDSDEFDQLFFVENRGLAGFVPVDLSVNEPFLAELRELVGRHSPGLSSTKQPTGLVLIGVLPYPTRSRTRKRGSGTSDRRTARRSKTAG